MLWLLTVLSILGVVLNINKRRVCFVVWGITNFSWAWIDFKSDLPEQAALFLVYFVLAVWGWFKWRKQ
jgi:nicotinamide riboside transporter PnuC